MESCFPARRCPPVRFSGRGESEGRGENRIRNRNHFLRAETNPASPSHRNRQNGWSVQRLVRTVSVDLAFVHALDADRTAIFDFSEERAWAVHDAGFGVVIVEGQGRKALIARGRNSDLVGMCRKWGEPYRTEIGFKPESAVTIGGWFAKQR